MADTLKENLGPDSILSTHQAAKYLGMDMTTVIKWCSQGKIRSFKTPGGHRRIKVQDLVAFLKEFKMPIPKELQTSGSFTCLIVDDEAPIRNLLKRTLLSLNKDLHVEEASDGFSAGEKVAALKPDLIFLDINLPGLDGVSVCKAIRANPQLINTYIISISGRATSETKNAVMKAGADEFLPKPLDLPALRKKLAPLLPQTA